MSPLAFHYIAVYTLKVWLVKNNICLHSINCQNMSKRYRIFIKHSWMTQWVVKNCYIQLNLLSAVCDTDWNTKKSEWCFSLRFLSQKTGQTSPVRVYHCATQWRPLSQDTDSRLQWQTRVQVPKTLIQTQTPTTDFCNHKNYWLHASPTEEKVVLDF